MALTMNTKLKTGIKLSIMKKFLTLSVMIFLPLALFGQLTPVTNQYILNPLTINSLIRTDCRGIGNQQVGCSRTGIYDHI